MLTLIAAIVFAITELIVWLSNRKKLTDRQKARLGHCMYKMQNFLSLCDLYGCEAKEDSETEKELKDGPHEAEKE